MQAISILNGAVPTLIAAAGPRDFLHVYNNSDTTIYIGFDGISSAALTTANGMPIVPGEKAVFDNVGPRNIYNKAVYGVHGAGVAKEVRVAGV